MSEINCVIESLELHKTFGVSDLASLSNEDIDMAINALEKQIELSQMIADIKKDFNKDDTYSVSLVLELLESVRIGGKNE